ncbi:MAG: hypothetical protein FJ004_08945 [Chloroflexi bacterium]|nr:hypothetical protein [Chloroflexota bacterium]
MKHAFIVLFSAVLLLSANVFTSHNSNVSASEELLQNGGFEQGTDSWNIYNGELSTVESPVHGGSSAARLVVDIYRQEAWIHQIVDIVPGGSYTLTGYVLKNDSQAEHVRFQISWWDETEEIGLLDSTRLTTNSPEYQSLTLIATAPAKARAARVRAIVRQTDPSGSATVYFDDISFTGPAPTPAPSIAPTVTPSPTPAVTPTPTATSSPTPSITPTLTITPSVTHTPTPTPRPTLRPTPTSTVAPTPAPTVMPSLTPAYTPPLTPTQAAIPVGIGEILINEVQYDPPQAGVDSAFEWLELLNCTDNAIDLTGWTIEDNIEIDVIPSLMLPARSLAIVAASSDFYTNFPGFSGIAGFIPDGSIGNGLSNTGDCLILSDSTGKVIDALSYGDNSSVLSPPCPDVNSGHSLERQPAGWDTDHAGDFIDNTSPSPGYGLPSPTPTPTSEITPAPSPSPAPSLTSSPVPTATLSPTPNSTLTPTPLPTYTPSPTDTPAPQSIPTPANEGRILINEIQYDPPQSGVDYSFEWIEILNCSEHSIDLNGWGIADNYSVDPIPSFTLPAGCFAVIAASADFHINFPNFSGTISFITDGSIGNGLSNDGDRLSLTDSTGKIIDALSYGSDTTMMLPPCLDVHEGHSLERQPAGMDTDTGSDFVDNEAPSPGNSLLSVTPTPMQTTIITPAPLLTPAASSEPPSATTTPSSTYALTITITPPVDTPINSTGENNPWSQLKIPLVLFIVGLTLFTTVFWLKK